MNSYKRRDAAYRNYLTLIGLTPKKPSRLKRTIDSAAGIAVLVFIAVVAICAMAGALYLIDQAFHTFPRLV